MSPTNKKNRQKTEDWSIAEPLQKALNEFSDLFFERRRIINQESHEWLSNNPKFKREISRVKKIFNIPTLKSNNDVVTKIVTDNEETDYTLVDSKWMLSLEHSKRQKLDSEISRLLEYYKLPNNFYGWVVSWLLYNEEQKVLPFFPTHHMDLFFDLLTGNFNALNTPLDSKEVKFIKLTSRIYWNIGKGRLSGDNANKYRKLLKLLKTKKEKTPRRMRTFTTALESVKLHGSIEKVPDADNINRDYTLTYLDVAGRIYPNENGSKDRQIAKKISRQAQRLRKRKGEN